MNAPVIQAAASQPRAVAAKAPRKVGVTTTEPEDGNDRRRHTSMTEFLAMVTFIEKPENFALLEGKAAKNKSVVSGQKLTKMSGYKLLAEFVNAVIEEQHRKWTPQLAKSRYTSYRDKKYKVTKKISAPGSTGYGITEEDRRKNITTIAEKLERICPFYERMDAVLGSRQNVTLACVVEAGVPPNIFPQPPSVINSDDDDDDDDESEKDDDSSDDDNDEIGGQEDACNRDDNEVADDEIGKPNGTVAGVEIDSQPTKENDGNDLDLLDVAINDDSVSFWNRYAVSEEDRFLTDGWPDDQIQTDGTPCASQAAKDKPSSKRSQTKNKRKSAAKTEMNATRLSFPSEPTPQIKKGKTDFITAWIEMQSQHLALEQERSRRDLEFQQRQAELNAVTLKNDHRLATQIAKGNFIADLMKCGRSVTEIKEMVSMVFHDS